MMNTATTTRASREKEEGFLLLGVIVMVALVLLVLSIAAPKVAFDLRREKELEAVHRGDQYTHAIRVYYQKIGSYPGSLEQLEKTNNIRFLRQRYLDPMTGKADWRLIPVGQNKTTVRGFFGQPLAGIASSGLGTASSMSSTGTSGSTAFGSNTPGSTGTGVGASTTSSSDSSSSAFGTTGTSSTSASFGSGGGFGSGSGSGFGSGSNSGPFMGVGLPKDQTSVITLNEQTNYSTWEFLYDPRIEQMYAKSNLLGGGMTSTSASSLGTASSMTSSGNGFGNSGTSSTSPSSSSSSSSSSSPTAGTNSTTPTTNTPP
jgi:type II secretory pathway pseudopilin PulG